MFNNNERSPRGHASDSAAGNNVSKHGNKHAQRPKGGLPPPKKYRQNEKSHVQKGQPPPPSNHSDKSSTTLPNPGIVRHQSRVRVQAGAGDKCVAPAKSKIKKRTAVPGRPVDNSGLSMDSVIWTDETFTTEKLMQQFGPKLPIIVKIVECRHLNSVRDLSLNQVVQIHSYDKQKRVRVVVKSTTGKLSLPANYPIEVFITDSNTRERMPLEKAMQEMKPPFDVQVMSIAENIDVSTVNILGRHLTITEQYEENFLRANYINDGWVDQENIHAIPGYLGAVYSVATGMRDATREEWFDYYGMFARSVRHLRFHLLSGYYGIIVEDDAGGSIETKVPGSSGGPVYENLSREDQDRRASTLEPRPISGGERPLSSRAGSERGSHPYENWSKEHAQKAMSRSKSEKIRNRPVSIDIETGFDPPPHKSTKVGDGGKVQVRQDSSHSEDGLQPVGSVDRRTGVNVMVPLPDLVSTSPSKPVESPRERSPRSDGSANVESPRERSPRSDGSANVESPRSNVSSPRRPETPFSDADDSDVEEMFQSVLDVAEKQESLRRERESLKRGEGPSSPRVKDAAVEKSGPSEPLPPRPKWQANHQNFHDSQEVSVVVQHPGHPINLRPSYRSSGSSRDSKEANPSSSIEAEVHRNPSPRVSVQTDAPADVRNLASRFESPKSQARNPSNSPKQFSHGIFQMQSQQRTSNSNLDVPFGRGGSSRASSSSSGRVQTSSTDFNANDKPKAPTQNDGSNDNKAFTITDMEDVPKVIDNLDVERVAQCLKLLNMEHHVTKFKQMGIDGKALSNMNENALVSELSFTPFNASKLMRFARGWRPKLT